MASVGVTAAGGPDLRRVVRALRSRNYRLFFAGQGISLIGTWMQQIALSWLVYRLTGSPLLLGVVGFASQIPTFLIAPFSGVMADRWNRHRILLVTQSLAMLQAGLLASLVLTGRIAVWHILVLGACLGLVNAFDIPARQSLVVDMIEDKADLPNAIALNSSMVNSARLIGPAVAGLLVAAVGEGICFLINSLSYLAVIAALAAMKIPPRPSSPRATNLLVGLKEGMAYAFGFAPIRALLLLLALVSMVGTPYTVLMPVFATKILHGGASTLGFLTTASGTGALAGGLYLASRKSIVGLGRVIVGGASLFGLGLIAFSWSRHLWLSLAILPLAGFGMMAQMASSNTILQTIVEDDKRGRVMSLYTMAFMGMAPLGSLLAGTLASHIGAPRTLTLGGACCLIGAPVFARQLPRMRTLIRPIYVRIGVIPDVAAGLGAAAELTVPPEER